MKKISFTFLFVILSLVIFFAGGVWEKHKLLEGGATQLQNDLILSVGSEGTGILPKGTTMYPWSTGPSINTYVVFVNTKNTNLLKPINFEHYLTVDPIEGYSE